MKTRRIQMITAALCLLFLLAGLGRALLSPDTEIFYENRPARRWPAWSPAAFLSGDYQAAAVGMPSKDTVKIADAEGFAAETPPRAKVWLIQTPQAFSYPLIVEANRRLMAEGRMSGVTDDAMIVEASGLQKVKLVEGSYGNVKLTTPEDLWRL